MVEKTRVQGRLFLPKELILSVIHYRHPTTLHYIFLYYFLMYNLEPFLPHVDIYIYINKDLWKVHACLQLSLPCKYE